MKVYITTHHMGSDEYTDVMGVYSTLKNAKEYIAQYGGEILERELDTPLADYRDVYLCRIYSEKPWNFPLDQPYSCGLYSKGQQELPESYLRSDGMAWAFGWSAEEAEATARKQLSENGKKEWKP